MNREGNNFADRLNTLFAMVHPPGRKPHTNAEVARALTASGHPVSKSYISQLRSGAETDPPAELVAALAVFFRVRPDYFDNDIYAAKIDEDLALRSQLEGYGLRLLSSRAFPIYEEGFGPQQGSTSKTFDVCCTREFAAPVAEVWRAWEDPAYVIQWWAPPGFTSPSADMDFRVGGTSMVCLRTCAETGRRDIYNTLTYHRIEPTSLIEFDLALTTVASKGAFRTRPRRHFVTFTSAASKWTAMTVTEFGYSIELERDHAKAKLEHAMDKMTLLLEQS